MISAAGVEVSRGKTVVGISDLAVTSDPTDTLITYALGSCLGITVYDREAGVGGLLHVMLPNSETSRENAAKNPARFVDTGVPLLFKQCYELGARKERMILRVAGGASVAMKKNGKDGFEIGKRNFLALKKLLWKNGVLMKGRDVGGFQARTVTLVMGSGQTLVKSGSAESPI